MCAGVKAKRLASKLGLIAFLLALAYLSVLPLVRLQIKAFSNNGQPYRDAFTRDGSGQPSGTRWSWDSDR